MNRILEILADPANTAELLLFCLCLTLIVLCAIAWAHDWATRRRSDRWRIAHQPSTRCERAGSIESFQRLMRARQP